MNCETFRARLTVVEDGSISSRLRQQWESHMLCCASCLEFYAARYGASKQELSRLSGSIIAATSGNSCDTAQLLLAAHGDDVGPGDQAALLRAHVDDCTDCQRVETSLQRLVGTLAPLRSAAPPDGFTAAVLYRTTGQTEPTSTARPWPVNILVDLVRRPRFAAEAAFTLTLVWVLIFDLPTGILAPVANAEQLNLRQVINSARDSIDTEFREFEPVLQDKVQTLGQFGNQLMETGTRSVDRASDFASRVGFRISNWARQQAPDNNSDAGDTQ